MTTTDRPTMRRTGWDVVLGAALVVGAFVVMGDVVLATVVSLLVIGWTAVAGGVVLVVAAFTRIGHGFWGTFVGGVVLLLVGVLLLTNPKVGALTLTLFVGAAFFAGGVVRLVMVVTTAGHRWALAISGAASALIGVWVLANPVAATLTLLGTLLAVEMLFEGITLLVAGRVHGRRGGDAPGGPIAVA